MVQTVENLLASSQAGTRASAYKRFLRLENDRSSFRSNWQEISDYVLPRRGRYLLESAGTRGRKRSTKIIDNTAGQALRTLGAGMMSGLTSPARPWFRLMTVDDAVMEQEGVTKYLGDVEVVLRRMLSSTNFYNTASTIYHELGAFGTGALMRRKHPQLHVHYRPFTAGEYVLAENEYNQVDTLGREFTMTVSQIVEEFAWDAQAGKIDWTKVTPTVRNLWNANNYDELIPIVHMIQPRRDSERDLSRMDGLHRPFADMYFEKGADNDALLRNGGFNRFPVFAPRWDVMNGDIHGYSPAMEHLGDIKQLQHEQRRKAQAIDKMVNPPMVAPTSMKGSPVSVLPAGVTYVDQSQGVQGFQPAYQVQPRINELTADIQEVQQRIQRGFYADLFAMMINSDRKQITATEVVERHEEKLVLLGPVLQRLNTEYLDPTIEDAFIVAGEAGLLPEAPEALQGADLRIKYVGLLAQAQEAASAAAMERTMSFAGNLTGVAPDILDNFDMDAAVREYADILGNSPSLMREKSARDEIRKQRADAEQAAQQQEQMAAGAGAAQQGAQAAKLLSETDTQGTNALTDLLQRGGTTV